MGTRSAEFELKLQFSSNIKNTLDDGQVASLSVGQQIQSGKLETGVSANQSNRGYEDRDITITSGNTLDIDLYDFAGRDIGAGAGADGLGQAMIIEEIVSLVIKQTAGPGRLEIMPSSPAGAVTWLPAQTVANGGALKSGGIRLWFENDTDALDIQDGVSHVVRFGANGGNVTFDLYLAGRHDDDESSSSSSSSSSTSTASSASSASSSSSSSSSETSSVTESSSTTTSQTSLSSFSSSVSSISTSSISSSSSTSP